MLDPGDMLGHRYRLDEFLAAGGMGQVWRATDTVLGRTVAVKLLLPALLTDPDFEARFRAEARIIATLRHAGVVNVYDYGESTDADGRRTLYLVMAYVDGESLSQRLAASGRLTVAETMSVIAQAADALEAAHASGVVHRDVKPGNLLVQPDGTVTLVDFGVARSTSVTSVTTGNSVPGTALYMAPEQATGQPVSAVTDVYALGAVAYHCLAGHPPFSGNNPIEIALQHLQDEPPPLPDDVPPRVRALIQRAMAKDPADRFASASAFAAAARAAVGDSSGGMSGALGTAAIGAAAVGAAQLARREPTTAHDLRPVAPIDPEHPVPPDRSRRRRAALAGAAAAVLVVAGALIALLGFAPGNNTPPPVSKSSSAMPSGPAQSKTGGRSTGTAKPSASASAVVVPPVSPTPPPPSATKSTPSTPPTTGAPSTKISAPLPDQLPSTPLNVP